jgi:hypothetical protein
MWAADHSLALQEGWALNRSAHDGLSLAKAAKFEQVLDEERAFACAARNADVAAAEAAELWRWPARRFDGAGYYPSM